MHAFVVFLSLCPPSLWFLITSFITGTSRASIFPKYSVLPAFPYGCTRCVCSHYPLVPYSLILRFCLALWSVFLLAFNPRSLYILSGHGFSVYFRAPLAIIIPLLLFHEYYYHSYSTLMIKYFSCQLLSCRGRMEEDEMGCDDWCCHHQLECCVLWIVREALKIVGLPAPFCTMYAEILPNW